MTVRRFDGDDDRIGLDPGATGFTGAGTWLMVWRTSAVRANGLAAAEGGGGFQRWGHNPFSDGIIYYSYGGFRAADAYSANVWYLSATTKPAAVTELRSHRQVLSTGVWDHTDRGTVGDGNATQTAVYLGQHFDSQDNLQGDIACMALWYGTQLSDGDLEGIGGLADIEALNPDRFWVLDQDDVGDPVLDRTGNSTGQTSIIGTTVLVGDDPPNFDMGGATAPGSTWDGAAWAADSDVQVWDGAAWASGTEQVWDGAAWV